MTYSYNFDFDGLEAALESFFNGGGLERFLEVLGGGFGIAMLGFIFTVAMIAGGILSVITIAAKWMLFDKARENGWAAIIPFYGDYVLYKITWGNGWFFLLALIPVVNIVIHIITMVKLSAVFGKGGGWACGLIFLNVIFLCIMAFDKSIKYVGEYGGGADAYRTADAGFYRDSSGNTYGSTAASSATAGGAKFCPQCGAAVSPGDKFCLQCGKPL